ncbi:c-type cytochrome [Albibacterium indicum]|uniref:c-type cytochrome n=1 Tax=Albibacterium indicum TaxID=2292082 RepID=UPI000E4810C7|nr:c-type cytochrome [Pedobacter indicus]
MTYKKTLTLLAIISLGIGLSAFMPKEGQPATQEYRAKNLKVLPKDISKEELDDVMDGFKVALGVKCGHCHAPRKDDASKLDFASDDKIEKEIARKMMKMTAKINKKYFHRVDEEGIMANISCMTCHNGKVSPETIAIQK